MHNPFSTLRRCARDIAHRAEPSVSGKLRELANRCARLHQGLQAGKECASARAPRADPSGAVAFADGFNLYCYHLLHAAHHPAMRGYPQLSRLPPKSTVKSLNVSVRKYSPSLPFTDLLFGRSSAVSLPGQQAAGMAGRALQRSGILPIPWQTALR